MIGQPAYVYSTVPIAPQDNFQQAYFAHQADANPLLQYQPPLQSPDFGLKSPYVAQETYTPYGYERQRSRWGFDLSTLLLLLTTWGFLILSCIVLLYVAHVGSEQNSLGGQYMTWNEIASAIALSSVPILCATVVNEVLMSRCWQKVECLALGSNPGGRDVPQYDNATMARHLRAANFGWYKFLKRMITLELSLRDVRTLCSWMLLRWGTALAIASTQLCVNWHKAQNASSDAQAPLYTVEKRIRWLALPIFIHFISTAGTLTIFWFQFPWALFSDRYDDEGLWESYEPYLQRVQGGSIASCDSAAKFIQYPELGMQSLERKNKPGIQFGAKLKGIWFGLLIMHVPAALALLYTWRIPMDKSTVLRTGLYRFVFHFVFLAQNIFYVVALDFIIWNLSLEGLCRSTSAKNPRVKSKGNLRHLRESAGLLLVIKAFKQRRPLRSALFTWLFWLQACAVRFLTVLYIFAVSVVSYGPVNERKGFYDHGFWLAWVILTAAVVYPLILVWLFTPFQAPICEQDGWRWAHVVRTAYSGPRNQLGYYGVIEEDRGWGVKTYRAVWGPDVQTFKWAKGKKLT